MLLFFFSFIQKMQILIVVVFFAASLVSIEGMNTRPGTSTPTHSNTSCNHIQEMPSITSDLDGLLPSPRMNKCVAKIIPILICNKVHKLFVCKSGNGCGALQRKKTVTFGTCCRDDGKDNTTVLLPHGCY